MAIEKIMFTGNIGSAQILTSRAGVPYGRMSVATDRLQGSEKVTIWYQVMLFGAMVKDEEKFTSMYRSGRLVFVEGRPQFEAYIKNNGKPDINMSVVATAMPELLDSPRAA